MTAVYFGNPTDTGGSTAAANFAYFFPATCTLSGNVTDGRFGCRSGPTGNAKLAVYADTAGAPSGSPLGVSNVIAVNATGTLTTTYPTPFAVVNGTQYWLAWLFSGAPTFGGTAVGTYYFKAATYPNFPAPLSSPTSGSGLKGQMEAGVTAAGSTFVPLISVVS